MKRFDTYLSPDCCQRIKETKVIFLHYFNDEVGDTIRYKEEKPEWAITGRSNEFSCDTCYKIEFCPFCLEKLPEIIINTKIKPEQLHDGDGYYCGSCKERVRECDCLPPEFKWKPAEKK